MPQEIGLRARYSDPESADRLPDHVLSALKRIEEWNLEGAKRGAVRAGHLEEKEVDEVERELRRFLAVCLLAREGIVEEDPVGPTGKVDALWHAFILDTESYVSFCQQVMGGFVHHAVDPDAPGPVAGDGMRKLLDTYFEGADVDGVWAGQLATCWPSNGH